MEKIGPYKQHTLIRLQQHNILKLEHELEIQEAKLVWKWSKGKIPSSLKDTIKEKPNTLRSRRFESLRNVKLGKGIKVENFNVETRFGHGALRSKHELELNVDRFCHGF